MTNERVRLNYGELFAIHASLTAPTFGADGRMLTKTNEELSAARKIEDALQREEAKVARDHEEGRNER